jgi:hypothetical protein
MTGPFLLAQQPSPRHLDRTRKSREARQVPAGNAGPNNLLV